MAAACVFVLGATITLATLVNVPLGAAANLGVAVSNGARPPWYFLFVHQLLEAAPPRLLGVESADFVMAVLTLVAVLVAALPFIDRRGSRVTWWAGTILLALYLGLTAYASV